MPASPAAVNHPAEPPSRDTLLRCLRAVDLTRLEEDDDPAAIAALCAAAVTPYGPPAALCVYPEWVATCRTELARHGLARVPVATVVNFPDGGTDAERAGRDTRRALGAGADEIDVVFPYRAFAAGDRGAADGLVRAVKAACGSRARLKVILETGVLGDAATIRAAADLAIAAGADYLKTSTGKVAVNATLPAARTLLEAIRDHGGQCGFKASGGIRTAQDARAYLELADALLGPAWATPQRFRLGASALLGHLVAALDAAADG